MAVYAVIIGLYSVLTFRHVGGWCRGAAVCIWSFVTILLLDGVGYMLVSALGIHQTDVNNFISDLLTLGILFLIFGVVNRNNPHQIRKVSPVYFVVFTLTGMANIMVLSMQYELIEAYSPARWPFFIVCIGFVIQMLMILMLAVSRNLWKEKEALNSYYLSIQQQYYEYLEEREKETKRFRHDMRGHLYVLEHLISEGKGKEAGDYLKKTFDAVDTPHRHISIGNPIVEAILMQYMSICEQKGILFEIKGHMPVDCNLPAFELCTIFSNLLQNAVEAVESCGDRKIRLQFRYDKENVYVCLTNTCQGVRYADGELLSTKEGDHGYGIRNIRRCIYKCGGMMESEAEGGFFQTFLQFPQAIRLKE